MWPSLEPKLLRTTSCFFFFWRGGGVQGGGGFKFPFEGRQISRKAASTEAKAWEVLRVVERMLVEGHSLEVIDSKVFLEDQGSFYANHDDEGDAMRRFVDAWWNSYQDQVVQVATLLPLAAQVDGLGITAGGRGSSVRLGSRLRREVDRIYAGVQIQSPGSSGHARQYRLRVHQPDSRSTPATQRCSESALRALP